MKYNLVFKFVAVLLCAASLAGILGTGLGIFAMTEAGLYNRTVDQMLEEMVQSEGHDIAQRIASRYASTNLGGVPQILANQCFPEFYYHYGTINDYYEYRLMDPEGNVLEGTEPVNREQVHTLSFPVDVQYIHLVSLLTEEEKYPSIRTEAESAPNAVMTDGLYVYDAVPPEGAAVTRILCIFADGSHYQNEDAWSLGSLYYTRDGQLTCLLTIPADAFPVNTTVTEIILASGDNLLYEANAPDGVGYFTPNGNHIMFVSTIAAQTPSETVAETVEETIAETTEETVPETTVPETTVPETIPFVPAEVTDNIPEDEIAEVVTVEATLSDGKEIIHEDEYGVGRVQHEKGTVVFNSYEYWEAEFGRVVHILFVNEKGETLYEASHEDGVGELFVHDNHIRFCAEIPEPPVVETVPETEAATTAPETEPETVPETTVETVPETVPEIVRPALINGKPLQEYDILTSEYYDADIGQRMYAEYVYTPIQGYTVELYLTDQSFTYGPVYEILRTVREFRAYLLPALGACILLFFVFGTYLVCATGHKPKSDVRQAGGLNRIPLDLYLVIVGIGIPCLIALIVEGTEYLLRENLYVGCAFAAGLSLAGCLLVVSFLFAMVAQFKSPDGYWWRNLLCAWFIRGCFRMSYWLDKKAKETLFPFLRKIGGMLWILCSNSLVWLYRTLEKVVRWTGCHLGIFFRWLKGVLHRFLSLLPLTWQWLVSGLAMFLMVAMAFATNGEEVIVVLCLGFSTFLIVYGAHCFGTLLDSTKKMRKGNLDTKVDDKMMVGAFKEFAGELNELAGVAVVAAQKQLNSERMKSELITNVSHDIKTPLTSIINYADLLQKPHTEEEGAQYLEVLSRQSLQLKKLLEDLMEMSKASTGNMNVEITYLDAVEAINQALGEFADKLDKVRLTPVFRHTEHTVPMMADGRLLWRVLSNLLGNVVKYAMPGTRLYLDLMTVEDDVVISIKNISREELNVDADELMERFVRGDDSRNTDGSGLGLNIAKSLVELQKGQMQLLVDGDLFKVTLIFPAAE